MDFSSMRQGNAQPSDIDLFWLGKHTAVFGEIKNELGPLKYGQRKLLEKLADGFKPDAMVIFITHDKYVQDGDTKVDVGECFVAEYYYHGQWVTPTKPLKVKEVIAWA